MAEEASGLLARTELQRGDTRWLRGERVDVMLSPVPGPSPDDAGRVLVTLTSRREHPVAGLILELTDDEGGVVTEPADGAGQAVLQVSTVGYRLQVHTPQGEAAAAVAPPAVAEEVPLASGMDAPDQSSRLVRQRRRSAPPQGPGRPRRTRRLAPLVLTGLPLGLLAMLVGVLTMTDRPAVAVVEVTDGCGRLPGVKRTDSVVVAAVWSGSEKQRFTKVLGEFRRSTGIDVTFATSKPVPDRDLGATLDRLIEDGCAPDVALLPQPGLLRELVQEGRLQPVDPITSDLVARNYAPAWNDLGSVDDALYGVWFKAALKSNIWYSTKAFAQARIAPPTTWDELKVAAAKLAESGTSAFAIGAKDGWTLTDWFETVYLRTAGPEQYQRLAERGIRWTDPSVELALRTLAEIFGQRDWIAGGPEGAQQKSYEEAVQLVFGRDPKAAMIFAGDFVATEIAGTKARVGEDARPFPFPSISTGSSAVQTNLAGGGGAAGGDVAVVLKGASEAGQQLMRYLATPEAATPWVQDGGFTSPNKAVDLRLYKHDADRTSAADLTATQMSFDLSDLQPTSFGSTPGRGMGELLRQFLSNPADVSGTAHRLEAARAAAGP